MNLNYRQILVFGSWFIAVPSTSFAATLYVDLNNSNPVPPYTNWESAAVTIQDAVDSADPGDQVLVTNGIYSTGGRAVVLSMTNRVAVDKAVSVQSVNGPSFTIIRGYQLPGTLVGNGAVRCVYLTNGASLVGFTLTNGATRSVVAGPLTQDGGGGVWCESTNCLVSNCVIVANAATTQGNGVGGGACFGTLTGCILSSNLADAGGGAYSSVLNDCILDGNNASVQSGGAFNCSLKNCTLRGNSAPTSGGGGASYLEGCNLTNNRAYSSFGGAVGSCTLINCILSGNSSTNGGGGASFSSLTGCLLTGNSAFKAGGGSYLCALTNCVLNGNSAASGGGASDGTLNQCLITANTASQLGGGANSNNLNNCALIANSTRGNGGGANGASLSNCTVTGNSALAGGGAQNCNLYNSVALYNSAWAGSNYAASTFNYSCTAPYPAAGIGNLSTEPQLADAYHLSSISPCRGAGNSAYATDLDIDGEPWSSPPSIGCDEYVSGGITGAISVAIQTVSTNVAANFPVFLIAQITGHASSNCWDFADGIVVSNRPYASHNWSSPGDYPVVLSVYNEGNPFGVSAAVTVHVADQPIHYVALSNSSPASPYLSWETAATNLQDAIDIAFTGSRIVVSNGIYQTGGRALVGTMTNRVAVTKPLTIESVNGPGTTIIQGVHVPGTTIGDSAVRCVYLTNGATLVGFTLTNGATRNAGDLTFERSGGGVWCESTNAVLSNCVLVANASAWWAAGAYFGTLKYCTVSYNTNFNGSLAGGGGAYGSTLSHCLLKSNSGANGGGAGSAWLDSCVVISNLSTGIANSTANNCLICSNTTGISGSGAGALSSLLNNCLVIGNKAVVMGGGVMQSTGNNTIVYFNVSAVQSNYDNSSVLSYSCTVPAASGIGNITNAPLFANAAAGDFRIQSNSSCINAGLNVYAPGGPDLDGSARIVGGTIDIGPYEFQSPSSVISYAWLQRYGLSTNGSADYSDSDGDGLNNWQEWKADTNPTNATSALRISSVTNNSPGIKLTWQSVITRNYFVQRSTNLADLSPFVTIAANIAGHTNTTTYVDSTAFGSSAFFYRVGVAP